MNLGDFRRLITDLPDDYEIVASAGDAVWFEVNAEDGDVLIPGLGAPGVIILNGGQEVTEQYVIPYRLSLDEWVELDWRDVPKDSPKDWEIWTSQTRPYRTHEEHWWPMGSFPLDILSPDDRVIIRRAA